MKTIEYIIINKSDNSYFEGDCKQIPDTWLFGWELSHALKMNFYEADAVLHLLKEIYSEESFYIIKY